MPEIEDTYTLSRICWAAEIADCRFKSIKQAEPLLTLPMVIAYILKAYFFNFFLNRLNPNVARGNLVNKTACGHTKPCYV
jgi:hypothetical protein